MTRELRVKFKNQRNINHHSKIFQESIKNKHLFNKYSQIMIYAHGK